MKNKEIVSAVIGSTFFAVPYLVLAVPLAPSLIIGAMAFGAGELVLGESKLTLKDTNRSLFETLELAKKQNKRILSMIPMIEDESIRQTLNEIHESVSKIIKTIEKEPKKVNRTNNFFDYYLPITVKIVERYDEIENQKLSSSETTKFLKSTNKMIGEINRAYKKILEDLYRTDMVDMDAEMKVFDSLLKADGFNDAEFPVKKEEKEDE